MVHLATHKVSRNKPFKFFNYMADHDRLFSIVEDSWKLPCSYDGLGRIWYKLKRVRQVLKNLYSTKFKGAAENILYWRYELFQCQNELHLNPSTKLI